MAPIGVLPQPALFMPVRPLLGKLPELAPPLAEPAPLAEPDPLAEPVAPADPVPLSPETATPLAAAPLATPLDAAPLFAPAMARVPEGAVPLPVAEPVVASPLPEPSPAPLGLAPLAPAFEPVAPEPAAVPGLSPPPPHAAAAMRTAHGIERSEKIRLIGGVSGPNRRARSRL